MLTAKTEEGEILCLGEKYSNSYLQKIKKNVKFYCPICSEKVILKIGTKKINHFAHEKGYSCTDSYDRESEYHLLGKMQLFDWLKTQDTSPELEPYYKSIKQRPDIAFSYKGKTYCLEYQCSSLSEQCFIQRSEGYRRADLIPIWLLGGKRIIRKGVHQVSISSFQAMFLQQTPSNRWFLPSYCSSTQQFILLNNIVSSSIRNTFVNLKITSPKNMTLNDLLFPKQASRLNLNEWRKQIYRFKTQLIRNQRAYQDPFLKELYSSHLNPHLLPSYVGLPLLQNIIFETAPLIWQTYLFLDHIYSKNKGEMITLHHVNISLLKRISGKKVKLKTTLHEPRTMLSLAILEYLSLLEGLGILVKKSSTSFMIKDSFKMTTDVEKLLLKEDDLYNQLELLIKNNNEYSY